MDRGLFPGVRGFVSGSSLDSAGVGAHGALIGAAGSSYLITIIIFRVVAVSLILGEAGTAAAEDSITAAVDDPTTVAAEDSITADRAIIEAREFWAPLITTAGLPSPTARPIAGAPSQVDPPLGITAAIMVVARRARVHGTAATTPVVRLEVATCLADVKPTVAVVAATAEAAQAVDAATVEEAAQAADAAREALADTALAAAPADAVLEAPADTALAAGPAHEVAEAAADTVNQTRGT